MGKIICDICGTTYPDTADCCPICGCSRDAAMDFLGESLDLGEATEEPRTGKGRYAGKKHREIFDFDEVNAPPKDDTVVLDGENDEDDEPEDDRPHTNIFVIIGLTVLIALLLLATAFLCFRYILPGLAPETVPTTEAVQTVTTEPTEYAIPCQSLALNSGGEAVLTQEGQYFLIHVGVIPENTTDKVTYASADESIATVTEDGRITAVSEGETEVYIVCGSFQQTCKVICKFEEETVPTEAPTVPETAETAAEGETAETTVATEPGLRTDVTLKLKKTDITLNVYYEYQLLLDCDLKQDEVEWSVEHDHIVSVDDQGNIKALKWGTTEVIARYGDQEARCIVRCN
ncbi:MAG: Ig-like domain-containing protein [Eubacteriales bacterium]|nr:Ig-like domain-containing protein [Eubacteriales bacterium]